MPLNFPQVELTYDQKMALVGTDGPPTGANPYVTSGDTRLVAAAALYSATTTVNVSGSTAPTSGQALIATSATNATWQDLLKLATVAPQDVTKSTAAIGSSTEAAKADHKHDISTASPSSIGTSNTEGDATSLARSNHVHDHGSQSTATHHAAATTSANGFMSSTDKTKLDGVEAGATNTPYAIAAPVNVTKDTAAIGVANYVARSDHKHDISTATTASTAVQIGNAAAEGTSTSLARADHIHAVSAGTIGAVGTATSNGTEATFARADHVHAGLTRTANDYTVFTQKLQPVGGDMLLLEDSAASGAKKYASIGAILGAGATGSLTTAAYSSYSTPANPGTTYVTYHSWTTASVPAGTYRFSWSYEYNSNSTSTSFEGRVSIDGTPYQTLSVTPRHASDLLANAGFKYLTFTGADATHTLLLEIKRSGGGTVTCSRVDFEFWRINV